MNDSIQGGQPGEKALEMLQRQMDRAMETLFLLLETRDVGLPALAMAMGQFIRTRVDLPRDAACRSGCAHCCHLRVGASIPEVLVLFNGLTSHATPGGLAYFREKIIQAPGKGDSDARWRAEKIACPFLDDQNLCLIYDLRPFSCRAYHSLDAAVCREGFETGKKMSIPCFPLYRSCTDMYTTVFTRGMARKGLASYPVGFVKALELLFRDETRIARWFKGEDVFGPARIRGKSEG